MSTGEKLQNLSANYIQGACISLFGDCFSGRLQSEIVGKRLRETPPTGRREGFIFLIIYPAQHNGAKGNGNCRSAHQSKGTSKETVTKLSQTDITDSYGHLVSVSIEMTNEIRTTQSAAQSVFTAEQNNARSPNLSREHSLRREKVI